MTLLQPTSMLVRPRIIRYRRFALFSLGAGAITWVAASAMSTLLPAPSGDTPPIVTAFMALALGSYGLSLIWLLVSETLAHRTRRRRHSGRCIECGFLLRSADAFCTECGVVEAVPLVPAPTAGGE